VGVKRKKARRGSPAVVTGLFSRMPIVWSCGHFSVRVEAVPSGLVVSTFGTYSRWGRFLFFVPRWYAEWMEVEHLYFGAMSMLKKPVPVVNGAPAATATPDEDFRHSYPVLAAYLEDTTYEGGETRQTSTMTVFTELGSFKACLNDRAEGRSLFVSAPTFLGLLDALDACLTSDHVPWKVSPASSDSKARRGK